jgi:hypothetical protein
MKVETIKREIPEIKLKKSREVIRVKRKKKGKINMIVRVGNLFQNYSQISSIIISLVTVS